MTVTLGQVRINLAKRTRIATSSLIAASCITVLALTAALEPNSLPDVFLPTSLSALWTVFGFCAAIALSCAIAVLVVRKDFVRFSQAESDIRAALSACSSRSFDQYLDEIEPLASRSRAVRVLKEHYAERLALHLERILQREVRERRGARIGMLCRAARSTLATRLAQDRANSPIVLAQERLVDAITTLKFQKAKAEKELDRQREQRWLKLWFDLTRPDFAEVDEKIGELETALSRLRKSGALEAEGRRYDALASRIEERVAEIERAAIAAIPQDRSEQFDEDRVLRNATWLAAFSVPLSAWSDFSTAGDVYASLREVNGNYADLSDFEIWLDTLALPPAELAGLASLAKGAYFERLIESDLGGQRFEHFNHPDTDIVIDGTAYQVKATDSVSYVEGVPEDIPVISTTEIAEMTGSIDGGYLNADLTDAVDLSLGGTVIDISDTSVDAVLTGVGGVGIFAVLKGVWSGAAHYREKGDALGALSTGLSTTAVGTARTAVNAAEIVGRGTVGFFRSRPVRFAGRMIAAGGGRIDSWLKETQLEEAQKEKEG